jgi:hypothetical protein
MDAARHFKDTFAQAGVMQGAPAPHPQMQERFL